MSEHEENLNEKPTETTKESDKQQHNEKNCLDKDLENKIKELDERLKKKWLWPVKRKLYKIIEERLQILRAALLARKDLKDDCLQASIKDTLDSINATSPEAHAWDVADSLKELLPSIAPDEYLYMALLEEKGREKQVRTKDDHKAYHTWSYYFKTKKPNELISNYEEEKDTNWGKDRELVRYRLTSLYKIRNNQGRHDRAREGVRATYLAGMAIVLLIAVLLIATLWLYANNWCFATLLPLIVVIVSGALGSLLGRALRLRDLKLIVELTATWNTMAFQAVLGSTLAVIVLLVLKSEIIKIAGLDMTTANTVDTTLWRPLFAGTF